MLTKTLSLADFGFSVTHVGAATFLMLEIFKEFIFNLLFETVWHSLKTIVLMVDCGIF